MNDPYTRCGSRPDPASADRGGGGGDAPAVCRNLHGQRIDRSSHAGRFGLGNMTYDGPARHPAFCTRPSQLYDLTADPLEQRNLAGFRPDVQARLLALLLAHVRMVEAGNPAVARQAKSSLGCERRSLW